MRTHTVQTVPWEPPRIIFDLPRRQRAQQEKKEEKPV